MVESAQTQGYPSLAVIEAFLQNIGVELITDSNTNFETEEKHWAYGMMAAIRWATTLRVYEASDTTFKVVGGKYLWGNTVKTYTTGTAIDPTDNDTTYVWMKSDNTIGHDIDGNGWPTTEHIKLAEVVVDSSGNITSITDLRGESFLRSVFNVLYDGGTSVEALPVFWDSPSPADADEIRIPIYANNDVAEKTEVARITVTLDDVSDGSEDATISFSQIVAGVLTSIGEFVGTTATQTLTNKTIDGDDNTVQDLPLTAIKTDAGNASKFLERDGSGIPQSGKSVPTGDVVGTTDTQTLTNKTIDGDDNTVQDLPLTAIKTDAGNASKFLERDGSGIPQSGKSVPTGDVVGTSDTQTLTNKTIDGDDNTIQDVNADALKVVTSNMAIPFILTATLTGGNTVQIHNSDAPFKYRVINAWAVAQSADGGTWKVTDGTNDITNAVAAGATDKGMSWPATIDDAYHEIAASGSLSVVGDGSLADVIVYIECIRVS